MATPTTLKEVFEMMPDAFKPEEAAGLDVVFQFNISGADGGDWYITVKDQKCEVAEGQADNPTTTLKISDEDYVKMITGELDGMAAFTSGKLKVEGDMMKSQLLGKIFAPPESA
ncbi:MAG: SCP2 sterol-binding domain-containing protein [Deltaproteobacteria bacterium]|nr:SCP2 sterol-binding domain-containing protein [Deltaproteobacteria bacterium]